MRPSRAVAACAISALAMVFSVQQGEHGPLVIYKLQVPPRAAPAAPSAPSAGPGYVIPSRAPQVLGTVVTPGAGAAYPLPVPPSAILAEPVQPAPAAAPPGWATGGIVTLQQVNDDLAWRRETAEKLPEVPFAPRF